MDFIQIIIHFYDILPNNNTIIRRKENFNINMTLKYIKWVDQISFFLRQYKDIYHIAMRYKHKEENV